LLIQIKFHEAVDDLTVEELRADLSHVLTGMLRQRELEACVRAVRKEPKRNAQR